MKQQVPAPLRLGGRPQVLYSRHRLLLPIDRPLSRIIRIVRRIEMSQETSTVPRRPDLRGIVDRSRTVAEWWLALHGQRAGPFGCSQVCRSGGRRT